MSKSAFAFLKYEPEMPDVSGVTTEKEEADLALAKQVKSELGYDRLLFYCKTEYERVQEKIKVDKKQFEFSKALSRAGARPFTKASVELYKKRTLMAANRLTKVVVWVTWGLLIVFLVSIFYCLAVSIGSAKAASSFWSGGVALFSLIGISCCSVYLQRAQVFEWFKCPLIEYSGRVLPKPALQLALAIKEQLPYARFNVEALRGDCNPLLIVEHFDVSAYVYVWKESDDEAEKV